MNDRTILSQGPVGQLSAQTKGRLEPLGNKVLVRRDPKVKGKGSIIFSERDQPKTYLGTVEAVGPGLILDEACPQCGHDLAYSALTRRPQVKVGDRVILPELGGQEILDWDGGEPVVIIEEDFLHGRVV